MNHFEHACFISYKHPPHATDAPAAKHFWMEFVEGLERRLQSYLTIGLPVYRDDKLKLEPGTKYPAALSKRLCRSVCMIAVIVPEYLESSWCRAEWDAMETLEAMRSVQAEDGLIVPVLFRGNPKKAEALAKNRDILDFSHVVRPSTQLNTIKSRRTFEAIAGRIKRFYSELECQECDQFEIKIGPEETQPSFDDPNPLEL